MADLADFSTQREALEQSKLAVRSAVVEDPSAARGQFEAHAKRLLLSCRCGQRSAGNPLHSKISPPFRIATDF